MVGIELVRPLPANFDAGDRLAGAHDGFDDFFDLICNLRNSFANRASDVIGDGNTADLRQPLVDLHVAAIGRKKREADRSGVVDQLEIGRRLL